MYKYRITTIRLDTSIPWYTKDPTVVNHIQTTYHDTGMKSSEIFDDSSDDNINIIEVTFVDIESYIVFVSDPIVTAYIDDRRAYEESNGIIRFREDIN